MDGNRKVSNQTIVLGGDGGGRFWGYDRPVELTEDFVELESPSDPRLSPDGTRVVWVAAPYGHDAKEGERRRSALWIASVENGGARRLSWGPGEDRQPRWSPDGASIAFTSDRKEEGVFGLYLLRLDGGDAEPLHVGKRSVGKFEWSPDGSRLAFLSPDDPDEEDRRREEERDDTDVYGERWQRGRLRVIDLSSRQETSLEGFEEHITELTWSPDGDRIAFLAKSNPELDTMESVLYLLRVAGRLENPVRLVAPFGAFNLTWPAGDNRVLYTAPAEPLAQSGSVIWSAPLDRSEPAVVAPASGEEACAIGVRAAPGGPTLVTVLVGLSDRIDRLDDRTPLYAVSDAAIWGRDVAWPAGNPVIALVRSRGTEPAEVWAGSPTKELKKLSNHHDRLRGIRFGEQEAFLWKAPDGVELDGLFVRPPDARPGPLPTVVLVHGGPYGMWAPGFNLGALTWIQWLATAGFAVLAPNPRGGAGHGHAFAAAVRGDVGGADFADIMAGVDTAIERGLADPDRLGIGGWSQGGFMTGWAVSQTDRFKAGVMGAGVSDWGMMTLTSDVPRFEAELGGDRPWDGVGPHQADRLSPISYAANVKTPLLILHGQNDARVPVSQAIGFERALRGRGFPVELVTYPREPHGIGEVAHQKDVLRRVRAWYRRFLGVEDPAG